MIFDVNPFPVVEWNCVRFATYLSFWLKSVHSIKNYVSGICIINDINGYPTCKRGVIYTNAIRGLRRQLQHQVRQAKPMTREILQQIVRVVDTSDDKQLAIWVAMLFGFNLFLRKSNLVPEQRMHDTKFQLSRRDIKYHKGVMVMHIKWSKTSQFGEDALQLPMVEIESLEICSVKWCCFMINKIKAKPYHNLFSYKDEQSGRVLPVTYNDLTTQMRQWIAKTVGNENAFSSHSLWHGGVTTAFHKGIPELAIQTLGNWASMAYKRYINITLESRMKAWLMFSEF